MQLTTPLWVGIIGIGLLQAVLKPLADRYYAPSVTPEAGTIVL